MVQFEFKSCECDNKLYCGIINKASAKTVSQNDEFWLCCDFNSDL